MNTKIASKITILLLEKKKHRNTHPQVKVINRLYPVSKHGPIIKYSTARIHIILWQNLCPQLKNPAMQDLHYCIFETRKKGALMDLSSF